MDQELVKDILNEVKAPNNAKNALVSQVNNKQKKSNKNIKSKQKTTKANEEPLEEEIKKKEKRKKIKMVCASCGQQVKVYNDETICPKCDEPLKDD